MVLLIQQKLLTADSLTLPILTDIRGLIAKAHVEAVVVEVVAVVAEAALQAVQPCVVLVGLFLLMMVPLVFLG